MTPVAAGAGGGLSALLGLLVSDPVWATVIVLGLGVLVAVVATWWRRRSGDDRDRGRTDVRGRYG
ncbi:hypothetical protein [Modestobacter sp. SYSU DS0657]